LSLIKLDQLFNVFDSEEEAVRRVQTPSQTLDPYRKTESSTPQERD